MIDVLFENYLVAYFMLVLFVIGGVCKIIIGASLSGVIRESDNMNNTRQNLLKQIKLKFENCHRLNLQINNVSAFINKYIYKYKLLGVSIKRLNNAANTCFLLCITIGFLSGVLIYINSVDVNKIVIYMSEGIVLSLCGLIWNNVIDIKTKIEIIKINIQDFLENSLENKLKNESIKHEKINMDFDTKEFAQLPVNEEMPYSEGQVNFDSLQAYGLKNDIIDNNIIEEILKEYLA